MTTKKTITVGANTHFSHRPTLTRVPDGWLLVGHTPPAVFRTLCAAVAWRTRQREKPADETDEQIEQQEMELAA